MSNVYTHEGNMHCTYKKKPIIIASPDDLFPIYVYPYMESLGLKTFIQGHVEDEIPIDGRTVDTSVKMFQAVQDMLLIKFLVLLSLNV